MQQQAPKTFGIMLHMAGSGIRLNIDVKQERLPLFYAGKSAINVGKARSDGLDLRALQFDAGLVPFQDMILPQRLTIDRNIRAHKLAPPRRPLIRRYLPPVSALRRSAYLR